MKNNNVAHKVHTCYTTVSRSGTLETAEKIADTCICYFQFSLQEISCVLFTLFQKGFGEKLKVEKW